MSTARQTAEREGQQWAGKTWTAKFVADADQVKRAATEARTVLDSLPDRHTIDLRASLAGGAQVLAELRSIEQAASRLDGRDVQVRVSLAGAPLAIGEAQAVDMALDRIDGRAVRADVDADTAGAISGLAATDAAASAVDGRTVRINADTSGIDAAILKLGLLAAAASAAGIAATGALAGIGAGAAMAAPGLGAAALGFMGIGSAVSEATKAQEANTAASGKSASAAKAAAAAQENAAAGLVSAERALANARASAAESGARAARAVEKARAQASEGVQRAIEQEKAAEKTLADAITARGRAAEQVGRTIAQVARQSASAARTEKDARDALNDSYKTARQRIEDLQFQVLGGALAERRAVLNLEKATDDLNKARQSGVGGREMRELVLAYDEARLSVDQTAASNRRLAAEKADSDRAGVAGSKEVMDAQRRLADATDARVQSERDGAEQIRAARERYADADARVETARAARDKARAAIDKARSDGIERVREALIAEQSQQRQNQAAIQNALDGVARAQRAVQQANERAGDAGAAAAKKQKDALAELTPAQRKFAEFLISIKDRWKALQEESAAGFLPGAQRGIEQLLSREPEIRSFVGAYSRAMGELAENTGKGLAGEKWTAWFEWLKNQAGPATERFGTIAGNSLGGTAQLIRAVSPLWYEMADAIIRGTEAYEDWATRAADGTSPEFNEFMSMVRQYGPQVWQTIVDIAEAGWNVAKALAPAGDVALKFASAVLDVIEAAPPGAIVAVTTALIGLAAAWKGLKAAAALGNALDAAGGGLSRVATMAVSAGSGLKTLLVPSLLAATGPMQAFQGRATSMAERMGAGEQAASRFGSRMSNLTSSLPVLGAAFLALIGIADAGSVSLSEGAEAMERGGAAARASADEIRLRNQEPIAGPNWFNDFNNWMKSEMGIATSVEEVRAELEKRRNEMSALEAAQSRATEAQGNYDAAVREHGPASREAADAQAELARRTEDVKIAQLAARDGIDLATAAMRNQTDEALASANANLRKEQADSQLVDAQNRANEALKTGGANSKEYADAQREVSMAQIRAAEAAKQSDAGQAGYNQTVGDFIRNTPGPLSQTLQTLVNGMDQAGLASIGAKYDIDATGQAVYRLPDGRTIPINVENAAALTGIAGVAYAMSTIPPGKQVEIDAMTEPEQEKLRALGFTVVTLPNGHIGVTANDAQARNTLIAFQQFAAWQVANPQLAANPDIAYGKMREFLDNAGRQTGVPALDADPRRADETVRRKLGEFNSWNSTSTHHANTGPADGEVKGWWGRLLDWFKGQPLAPNVQMPAPGGPGVGTGRAGSGGMAPLRMAGGGVIGGYRPGVDDVPAVLSRGESVLVPELTRAIGPNRIMAANRAASGRRGTRYAGGGLAMFAGGGIAGRPPAPAAGGDAAAGVAVDIDAAAAQQAATSTDALTGSMAAAAGVAGMLDPMLASLAATQTDLLAPAQDLVTAGQQNLVAAGIDPLVGAMTGTLAPALAGYGQQVGVDAPLANAALQGAQTATQLSTNATALNTQLNAGAMTGAVQGTSVAQQYEHGMIRQTQGATMGQQNLLAQNTQLNTGAQTFATQQTSMAQQYEHGMIRGAQNLTMGQQNALAVNTAQNTGNMSFTTGQMSGAVQGHLGGVRGAQGVTSQATTGFADSWRTQLGRTVPDSANPLRHVINVPIGGIVNAWNTIDQQFALGKHVNPPAANFATGGVMPGYTPGRDVMTANVSGGEAIMRPEWTRAVGRDYIDDGNAAARTGGVAGVRSFLADASGSALQRLMGRYPLDDAPRRIRSGWAGAYAYGGVAPHVARAGDAVTRALGPMPGGIGGRGSRGNESDHPSGFALDFMTMANMGLGDRVAGMLQAQAEPMAVKYIIWKQAINQGRGWRGMENRGSPTANHFDHVHASFEGGPLGGTWGDGPEGGAMFDFGALVRDAFKWVFDKIVEVPKIFGPSDQVARGAGIPKVGADLAVNKLIEKLSSMFTGGAGGVPDVALANLITGVGKAMGFPRKGPEVALATALQESGLRNINYGDRDSLGVFQQRPSQGWGSPAQIMNPRYSAMKFYNALRGVGGWEGMPHTVAAQRVQRSAYPDAYAKWVGQAISLVSQSKLYDNGGPWPDGTLAANLSGGTEQVLTGEQRDALTRRLDRDETRGGDGAALVAVLEAKLDRLEAAVRDARGVTVYGAPHQSEESIAETVVRRDRQARRTVTI